MRHNRPCVRNIRRRTQATSIFAVHPPQTARSTRTTMRVAVLGRIKASSATFDLRPGQRQHTGSCCASLAASVGEPDRPYPTACQTRPTELLCRHKHNHPSDTALSTQTRRPTNTAVVVVTLSIRTPNYFELRPRTDNAHAPLAHTSPHLVQAHTPHIRPIRLELGAKRTALIHSLRAEKSTRPYVADFSLCARHVARSAVKAIFLRIHTHTVADQKALRTRHLAFSARTNLPLCIEYSRPSSR